MPVLTTGSQFLRDLFLDGLRVIIASLYRRVSRESGFESRNGRVFAAVLKITAIITMSGWIGDE